MKEKIKRSQVIKKRIVKSILWLVLTPFILLALVALLIHLPPVQNYISGRITTYLTEGTGYKTEIDYINIKWFNAVSVDGTIIYDLNDVKMIGIDEMVLTFKLRDLIGKQNFETGQAWVKGAEVNLRDETSRRLNIDDWVIKLGELLAAEPTNGPVQPAAFTIDEITLIESKFSISDRNRDSVKTGFDYNHFQLVDLNADLLNLKAVADTFQIDIKYLTARDSASGFQIDELKTFFRNSWREMAFYDLDLKIGKSRITDEVVFGMNRPSDMGYFLDSIDIRANFDDTRLHTDELSYFVPEFKKHNELVKIDGFFQGNVSDFFSDDFELQFGENTALRGSIELEGLPNIETTDFSVTLNNSTIHANDFQEYIGQRAYDITSKLGMVQLSGNFTGYVNDFVADGSFDTEIGSFSSNTNIEPVPGELATYDGGLSMNDFDLGLFTGDSIFQTVDMNGTIKGSGFTIEDAYFRLKADIPRVGINGYDYTNIVTDGTFAQSFFKGNLAIKDPNISLGARGSVDLRDQKQIFKIKGELDTAQLQALNIINEDVTIASNFDIDITGIKLDSILGNLGLNDTYFKYQENDIVFDSLLFDSQRDINGRKVRFASENQFDIQLDGQFEFTNLLDELQTINEEYRLIFSSRLQEVDEFLAKNKTSETPFNIAYRADLRDISPILQLFDTSLYVSEHSNVQGRFTNEQNTNLSVSANSDTVKWANIWFYKNTIAINSTDLRDASKVYTGGYLSSERQRYANTAETQSLEITANWDGPHIDIEQSVEQESTGNFAKLGADIDFYPDSTVLRFKNNSTLQALNEQWKIQDENRVIFGERRIDIKKLSVYNSDQSISFDGEVAVTKDSTKKLGIIFEDVSVANVNPLTSKTYTGNLSGNLSAQDIYFNPLLFGKFQLDDLRVNNFLVGDLKGNLNWNDLRRKFDLGFTVKRLDKQIISLQGDFSPSNATEQLKLDLQLNDANLRIAEPFVEEYFTELGGFLNGQYQVSGTTLNPVITGTGNLKDAQMKINYLNTKYDFNGEVSFKKNLIELSDMGFEDEIGSQADFNGTIAHSSFRDFRLNLKGDLNEFQVLNTIDTIGEPYYGTAYATGTVELTGEASNLTIAANVQTAGETRLFVPISEGFDESENPDYITFIDRTDTTSVDNTVEIKEDEVNKIRIEGLNLDLDIGVTPDAYVEIIIDPKSGDIIRGRGNGQLRLQIDPQGDFTMTGGLNIVEGGYNFSLYNIITKEFDIEQPSTITWYGDPYTGVLDLNASFSQNTSLQPILEQTGFAAPAGESGNTGVNRRFPTKVLLSLEGPMLSPTIDFDIDFSQIQGQENQVAIDAFKNRLLSDEQELNRQVLSLIVLNRFSDQGGITIGGRTTTQNVSQFLSNQFSQLIAQLDENLEVDLDLADLDQEAFNTFRLRLSYTFLDGRLRITREGGLTNLVDVNSIAGDWTAEYLLTDDGRYKVKVYSRNNYDIANLANQQGATTNTTGASITQTTSFNSFREFFSGVNKKRKKRKETAKKESSEAESGN
ncbi:translocation/assembly module TamB domain-containing protein [Roseivirga sp. E12]|uniref:translocation/assembly module TamB domain-containing protein n=1 Tax=Roseivirga sp. E12 TaxID=2819237 RepID=UPI001ABC2609|nr:translocation/assembly module TamB domain-containing protein [Roseivirga sp. E12]MBO3698488.1 translocation/assembly module TamB [Roseivirga sp. E12]